ncbi:hypothetical protein GCM10010168_59820 [Actinoplanes ianthinogenes]|uniref:Uncharacterized protein n=1 Tax=Actinoplanes ianthinogenes TaxID=122358 RepID=A0ABM7M3Z8_9ACTN|nr:hypothetical protein Aiant_70000 [Actinoplanes ianthinogenes]GGR33641.1 hypothetical protein GCM10010168_59820 [Actinoplanes ianthinogenes]
MGSERKRLGVGWCGHAMGAAGAGSASGLPPAAKLDHAVEAAAVPVINAGNQTGVGGWSVEVVEAAPGGRLGRDGPDGERGARGVPEMSDCGREWEADPDRMWA